MTDPSVRDALTTLLAGAWERSLLPVGVGGPDLTPDDWRALFPTTGSVQDDADWVWAIPDAYEPIPDGFDPGLRAPQLTMRGSPGSTVSNLYDTLTMYQTLMEAGLHIGGAVAYDLTASHTFTFYDPSTTADGFDILATDLVTDTGRPGWWDINATVSFSNFVNCTTVGATWLGLGLTIGSGIDSGTGPITTADGVPDNPTDVGVRAGSSDITGFPASVDVSVSGSIAYVHDMPIPPS